MFKWFLNLFTSKPTNKVEEAEKKPSRIRKKLPEVTKHQSQFRPKQQTVKQSSTPSTTPASTSKPYHYDDSSSSSSSDSSCSSSSSSTGSSCD